MDVDVSLVRGLFTLDPSWDFLNHGSFGACPRSIQQAQVALREKMERQPVRFLDNDYEAMLDTARIALSTFVGADPEGLAFVPNATVGVNTVLRSLDLRPGEALLVTNHAYNACRNALDQVARAAGARVVVAAVPFPLVDPQEAVDAILGAMVPGTRLALVDHVTSPTGLVLPIDAIVAELQGRKVDVLVDGAHAPGMVPLDLVGLGAAYYTGNCHKWLCAPKGVGFLWVREDRRKAVRPLVISHGANSTRTDRSRFRLEFDWTGTGDPTASLCVPDAIKCMGAMLEGGWPAVMRRNQVLALKARDILCEALGVPPPCPDSMIGSLAAVPLPDRPKGAAPVGPHALDPMQAALEEQERIEVPIIPWPRAPKRLVRVSAQIYNDEGQYRRLGERLRTYLDQGV